MVLTSAWSPLKYYYLVSGAIVPQVTPFSIETIAEQNNV